MDAGGRWRTLMAKLTDDERERLNADLDDLIAKKQTAQTRLHATLDSRPGTRPGDAARLRRDIDRYTGQIVAIQRRLR